MSAMERVEPGAVIGPNVTRLRLERGLSQGQLADRLGISRLSLGKIERGLVTPRTKTLEALARALGAPVAELVTRVPALSNVRFRARRRVVSREQILAETSAWLSAYSWLEHELDAEVPFALQALIGRRDSPQNLAAAARAALQIRPEEPVRDVCGLLEDHGVKVLMLEKASDLFFGLSVGQRDGGPAVVVNTWDRISVERWIFTAVHELGHILMHIDAYDRKDATENVDEEKDADRFASHFLMPEDVFAKEWDETSGLAFVDRVFKIKRIFRVSYKTVLYRLRETRRMRDEVFAIFQKQYRDRVGHTLKKIDEPQALSEGEFRFNWNRSAELGDSLSKYDFVGDRLLRLVREALDKGVISLNRAGEILDRSPSEMRTLAGEWVH
jgi:Zn-dependent peptidase ImmA (M78 family)/DNA-binding XRE family transcriptional regulator